MVACQAPLSIELSRQEYWSGLPCPSPKDGRKEARDGVPSPGDLLNPGIEPRSPALQANSLPFEPPGKSISMSKSKSEVLVAQPCLTL